MTPLDQDSPMRQSPSPRKRRPALSPDYVLAAVLIWSLILYGVLGPKPAATAVATRAVACMN